MLRAFSSRIYQKLVRNVENRFKDFNPLIPIDIIPRLRVTLWTSELLIAVANRNCWISQSFPDVQTRNNRRTTRPTDGVINLFRFATFVFLFCLISEHSTETNTIIQIFAIAAPLFCLFVYMYFF